jgi:predicted nucleic-acid-binding Zn-ribbon protein
MQIGILKYHCLKCGNKTIMELRPGMNAKTFDLFSEMFDAKLCLDCHIDKQVPRMIECLVN